MSQANKSALARIASARDKESHNLILLCDPDGLPELHRLVVTEVRLNTKDGAGDIYKHRVADKWCIHHQGKLKFAQAAAIEWDTVETRPVTLQRDFIHYQAVGQIRKEFGKIIRFRGDFEFDLDALREDLTNLYSKKADEYTDREGKHKTPEQKELYIRYCVNRDFSQKRTNRLKLAATGAKSVVIDKLLNLKAGYAQKAELVKPFLVVRCQIAPDLSDPEIRKQIALLAVQQIAGVYGPPPPAQIPQAHQYEPPDEEPPVDIEPEAPEQTGKGTDDNGQPGFEDLERDDQISIVSQLTKTKGYDSSSLPCTIEEMTGHNLKRFHGHLSAMPDKTIPPVEDDIPF